MLHDTRQNASGTLIAARAARSARRRRCTAMPKAASHSRIAFSSIASNTGARSPGEALMTCNTSAVAVCCSSASRVSVISRAFSIAITAWSAKVLHQLDLAFGEGLDSRARERDDADRLSFPQQGHAQIGTNARRLPPIRLSRIFWICRDVRDMHDAPFESGTPGRSCSGPARNVTSAHPPVPFRPHREGRSGPINVAVAGGRSTNCRHSHSRAAVSRACRAPAADRRSSG